MRQKTIVLTSLSILIAAAFFLVFYFPFRPPEKESVEKQVFVVGLKATEQEIVHKLYDQGFIRSMKAFNFCLIIKGGQGKMEPGGYWLSKNMNAWQVAKTMIQSPAMKWVIIPEGWRKEEIGEELAEILGWSEDELEKWNDVYTRMKFDYIEGVYFPDTYLIPVDEKGLEVAQRMTNRFNEKFAPYFNRFLEQDIKWATGLKIASLIQREAAGPEDMPLIASILWNRLLEEMKLEIDATLQYAKGKTESGWWALVKPEDKKIDSPYNTYLYRGLPPQPICNPGLAAIEAVLYPEETDCFYYLHDPSGQIHCAETYQEHKENIKNFLQ